MDHHRIHILGMKPISSCVVKSFLELVGMSRPLPKEPWFTSLLENVTGSDLINLVKQSLSQEDIALLPCSKALLMFPMVSLLRTTWQ